MNHIVHVVVVGSGPFEVELLYRICLLRRLGLPLSQDLLEAGAECVQAVAVEVVEGSAAAADRHEQRLGRPGDGRA